MAKLGWQQARNLLVVDPATGLQIEHVRSTDPDLCEIEVYKTTPTVPGYEMITVTKGADGKEVQEVKDYTFISMSDFEGRRAYVTSIEHREFDLVNKYTGEVVREARLPKP